VEIVPRRGNRIAPISASDLAQIYDLLATLEAHAAELAAARGLDDEALRPMLDAVDDMTTALEARDLDGWADADDRFHRSLVRFCGNGHLASTVFGYADRVHRARLVTLRLRPVPTASVTDHGGLVAAIRAGDAERAHDLHLEHRRQTSASLVGLLVHHRLSVL
jgi:DNA-binding GntR family transcriptional regulator